jgi:hypothetical protein
MLHPNSIGAGRKSKQSLLQQERTILGSSEVEALRLQPYASFVSARETWTVQRLEDAAHINV